MSLVPLAWTTLVSEYQKAEVARYAMFSRDLPQVDRDRATQTYSRAVDAMFAAMGQLSERGDLRRISRLMSRKDR